MQASNVFTTSVTTSAVSGSGDGTFQARTTFIGNASGAASVLEDLNGDGNLDLIVANGFGAAGTISIHLGNGNGTFAAPTTYAAYHTPTSIAVSDLNSDGKLDLTIANYYSDVSVHLGNGNGTFQSRVPYTMGSNSDCVITQDFNLDGKLDMVTADYTSGTLSIRLGNGDGTFLGRTTVAVGAGATSVTARDLNGDGKLDLVSTDKTDATLSICIGNGDGTFAARTTAATGVNPLVVLSQDLNGDGSMDVIVADGGNTFGSSTLDIFIANGNGTFQARTTVRVGGWADSLAATDINGDGKIDLLCTEDNNQNISVVIGNGNGTFQARRTLATGVGPIGISLGDVNDDDIKDILVLNASDNTIGLYLGNGTASTSTSTSTEPTSIYLDTQADAQDALAVLDTALAYIYSARSNIGAIQSRLDFATSVNMNTIENISAARSQIMDADMASTTAEFARLQILQQAGIAVLGQANLSLQTSLKLLQNL
jgi:flagellin-like hook-associated protein FlgL